MAELERVQRGVRRGGEGRHARARAVLRRAVPRARRQEVHGRDQRERRVRRPGTEPQGGPSGQVVGWVDLALGFTYLTLGYYCSYIF